MRTYNGSPMIDNLDELNLDARALSPTTSFLTYKDVLYQVFLGMQNQAILIKVPEMDESLIKEVELNKKEGEDE